EVRDSGVLPGHRTVTRGSGLGLVGVRERAALLGGAGEARPGAEAGWGGRGGGARAGRRGGRGGGGPPAPARRQYLSEVPRSNPADVPPWRYGRSDGTAAEGACPVRTSAKAAQFTESVIRETFRLPPQHGAINPSQGFPIFPCPPELKAAACAAIEADDNQYPMTFGTPALRAAI